MKLAIALVLAFALVVGTAYAAKRVEQPGSYSHATDGQFCARHHCIANFPYGRGFIVRCVDGEWSHSGGIQGACSYHGGEAYLH